MNDAAKLIRFRGGKWDGKEIAANDFPEVYRVPWPIPLERQMDRSEAEMPTATMRALIYRKSGDVIVNEQLERGPLGPIVAYYDFAGYER